jgi:site-specific recombinase XerD
VALLVPLCIERWVHAHGLRHAFAVALIRAGAPLYVVRDALGHASIATTQVYPSRVGAHEAVDAMRNRHWSPE